MRATIAAVLLGLSGCAATITVDWSANNHWRFTLNRLGLLIAIVCAVVVAMHMGFKLVRRYYPDKTLKFELTHHGLIGLCLLAPTWLHGSS